MLGEALSLGCALTWGVSMILYKQSEEASPLAVNLFKNALALLLLAATALLATGSVLHSHSREDWARLLVSGVLGLAVADTLFFEALRRVGAGMMAILDCAYAPLVVLFSVALLGERLGGRFALGAAIVFVGVVAATSGKGSFRQAVSVARSQLGGALMGLAAIAIIALSLVIAKPALGRSNLVEAAFIRMTSGFGAMALWVLLRRERREAFRIFVPAPVWRRLVPAAFLGCYVAMLLWLGGVKHTSASVASVLNQLSVLFTLVLARVVLREPLGLRRLLGGGASLAGAIVILLATPA